MSNRASRFPSSIFLSASPFRAALLSAFALAGATACDRTATSSESLASSTPSKAALGIHPLTVKRLDGSNVQLSSFAGKVLLVVNTASECGYTPQYEGLEALQAKFAARGFSVLGFPSNDFGGQEPGSSQEIATFCKVKFGVTFPLFEKVKTIGSDRSPLYALLGDTKGEPKWNFHKYLVDKKGHPVDAWPSKIVPESSEIATAIERELAIP